MAAFLLSPLGAKAVENSRIPTGHSLLSIQGSVVKWGIPDAGVSAVIRYAFVDAPIERPGARNCKAMEPVPARLENGDVAFDEVVNEFAAAFKAWQDVADLTFERVYSMDSADVLIGVQAQPRSIAFADVIHEATRSAPMAPITQGAVCFNPRVRWETGFDGNDQTYDVRYIATHEIGHVLGLDHSPAGSPSIMSFKYREQFRTPQPADIAGVVFLYGPRRIPTALKLY